MNPDSVSAQVPDIADGVRDFNFQMECGNGAILHLMTPPDISVALELLNGFSKENEVWRNDWIQIIRNCNDDKDWIPHKYSVICSSHFEANDLYTTKGGLRRVVTYALPQKFLFEPAHMAEEHPAVVPYIPSVSQESTSVTVPVLEHSGSSTMSLQREYLPAEPNISNALRESISVIGTEALEQPDTSTLVFQEEQPAEPYISSNIQENSPEIGADDENILSLLYTPRKRRLKQSLIEKQNIIKKQTRELKTLKQKVKRLQNRNKSLKDILKSLKDNNYVDTETFNRLKENMVTVDLFNNLNRKKLKKNIKYTPAIKKFCLTLNYYSPKAYNYVRQTFNTCLPHLKTLSKWYGHIKGDPGFTEESFQALKAKAQVSQHRPLCSLTFDEVAIRRQKIWDGKKYIGLEDMGGGVEEGAALASQALVFLLVGINHRFKLPLGYFLSNSLTGEQKANLIKICLTKCFESDVDVVSMTCDGHTTNLATFEILGCNLQPERLKTTFKHPSSDSEIACFLDPSHVIKLLRNQFQSKREFFDKDEKIIKWSTLENLNKVQQEEGLHLANKLSTKHINFKNNIMKVKLATQVFSVSVATAIKACREDLKLESFQDTEATETFIKNINDMFDIFNTRAMTQFDFRKPLCVENKGLVFNFLDELKEYILKLQIKYLSKRKFKRDGRDAYVITRYYKPVVTAKCKTGFLGTLMNIESIKYLYEKLIQNEKKILFLPTYKLSQDHLEMFFSCIRMQGGFNDNPNVRQFKGSYRKLLAHLEIRCLTTGNCVPLEQIAILNCTSATQIINTTTPAYRHEEDDESFDSSLGFLKEITKEDSNLATRLNIEQFNDYRKLIIGYLAGSISHYANKNIKCGRCTARLSTEENLYFHRLINLKTRGGLRFPSKDMFDICCICEMIIRKIIKESITLYNERQHNYILTKILEKFVGNESVFLNLESEHTFAGTEHKISLIKYIAEKYLTIRFHHISKLEGISRTSQSKRHYYKKITQHLGC